MGTVIFIIAIVLIWVLGARDYRIKNELRAAGKMPPKISDSLMKIHQARQERKATERRVLLELRVAQTEAYLASSQAHPGRR
jgi:hypothetical protein